MSTSSEILCIVHIRGASAIEVARQRGEGPSSPSSLIDAFDHFDEGAADRVLEESLAVRSVDRTTGPPPWCPPTVDRSA